MKVEVAELDAVRRKVEVELPENEVKGIEENVYNDLRRQISIKGFRPGKAPKSIITLYYKDQIKDELKKRIIDKTIGEALSIAKVNPIGEPLVDFVEEEGRIGYTLECEVMPDIELPPYKGIEVVVEPIKVTEEEIDARIEHLRDMQAELLSKEADYKAAEGDFVVISFQAYLNGEPVEDVKADAYPLELGKSILLPDFEKQLYGMKAGDEKEINIDFPEDYPDKRFAGKGMLFKVTLKEIREKRLPEIDDEFAKDFDYDDINALRAGIRKEIEREKEERQRKEIFQQIKKHLINATECPIPKVFHKKRADALFRDAKSELNRYRLTEEERARFEESWKADCERLAEESIKAEIILYKISQAEGITVDDSDVDEQLKRIAEDTRRSYENLKNFYESKNYLEELKANILEEKTLLFLKENAIIKEQVKEEAKEQEP